MSVSRDELKAALAERHKPLLVLYPEISSDNRADAYHQGWRDADEAPLREDYHPRDLTLVLDHARRPGLLHFGPEEHDRDAVIEAMATNAVDRIDILSGAGHADREEFWRAYHRIVSAVPPHERDGAYPYRAYANVVFGEDLSPPDGPPSPYEAYIAVEYWFLYLYNDWKATHEGDWELAIVYLRRGPDPEAPQPVACAYSAHHGGYRRDWARVERANDARARDDAGAHPIVYVANGSHANYFHGPGSYPTTTKIFGARLTAGEFPFTGSFVDFTTAFTPERAHFPDVRLVPPAVDERWSGDWRWLNFTGEWGTLAVPPWLATPLRVIPKPVRFRLLRGVWSAPGSLPPRPNWGDPFSWADFECEEGPVPGAWLDLQR